MVKSLFPLPAHDKKVPCQVIHQFQYTGKWEFTSTPPDGNV